MHLWFGLTVAFTFAACFTGVRGSDNESPDSVDTSGPQIPDKRTPLSSAEIKALLDGNHGGDPRSFHLPLTKYKVADRDRMQMLPGYLIYSMLGVLTDNVRTYADVLYRNKIVPYYYDDSWGDKLPGMRAIMDGMIADLHRLSCLRFKEVDPNTPTGSTGSPIIVSMKNGGGCFAAGRLMHIGRECWGLVFHELGHELHMSEATLAFSFPPYADYLSKPGNYMRFSGKNPMLDYTINKRLYTAKGQMGFHDIAKVNKLFDCGPNLDRNATGGWSEWSWWTPCSTECKRFRTRFCTNMDVSACQGPNREDETCPVSECDVAQPGGYAAWGPWLACSKDCGGGHQFRLRFCWRPLPAINGAMCPGIHTRIKVRDLPAIGTQGDHRPCNTQACGPEDQDGAWSDWSAWTPCTSGHRTRSRSCSNPPQLGSGQPCPGDDSEIEACSASGSDAPPLTSSFEHVGCYDNGRGGSVYHSARNNIDWKDLSKTVFECARKAYEKGIKRFAIHYWGECWEIPDDAFLQMTPRSDRIANDPGEVKAMNQNGCWKNLVGMKGHFYVYNMRTTKSDGGNTRPVGWQPWSQWSACRSVGICGTQQPSGISTRERHCFCWDKAECASQCGSGNYKETRNSCPVCNQQCPAFRNRGCWMENGQSSGNHVIPLLDSRQVAGDAVSGRILACAVAAKAKGYPGFVMKNGVECASSDQVLVNYSFYGRKSSDSPCPQRAYEFTN